MPNTGNPYCDSPDCNAMGQLCGSPDVENLIAAASAALAGLGPERRKEREAIEGALQPFEDFATV